MTELFGKAKGTLSDRIKHIFEDGELLIRPGGNCSVIPNNSNQGWREVSREVEHYHLDMVLALGFRVHSPVAVRFRHLRPARVALLARVSCKPMHKDESSEGYDPGGAVRTQ